MTDFVLNYAKELLAKAAAEPLMKIAADRAKEGDMPYLWYVAAMSLQPERADFKKERSPFFFLKREPARPT